MMKRTHGPAGGTPQDDSDIVKLFQDAFGDVRASNDYVVSLSGRLDAAFRALHENSAHEPSDIGIDSRHEAVEDIEDDTDNVSVEESCEKSGKRGVRDRRPSVSYRRRSLLAAAIAVSLLIVGVLWSTRPSYSWASMIHALESQPWIQMVVKRTGPETSDAPRVRHWYSRRHRVVAMRSADQAIFADGARGVRSRYEAGKNLIFRDPLPESRPMTTEAVLLELLLRGVTADSNDLSVEQLLDAASLDTGSVRIGRQSWREIENDEGKWIELSVEVLWGESFESRLELVLLLDPHTQLPRQCRVAGEKAVYGFDYPAEGPGDIYELDVPRDAEVVDSRKKKLSSRGGIEEKSTQNGAGPPHTPSKMTSARTAGRIDALLKACWARNGVEPVSPAGDEEFIRRAYLDLTGRIPSLGEVRRHIEAAAKGGPAEAWRERLVDELLAGRDHATHLATVWRRILLPDAASLDRYGGTAAFDGWLAGRFRDNVPYDEIVRELLLAEGRAAEPGPMLFYSALQFKPEAIAGRTARVFLGVRMDCAECHDHAFDPRWKQEDFWGYAAFFARISRPQAKMEMISPVLRVQDSRWGDVTLPGGDEAVTPRIPLGEAVENEADGASRRRRLADWLTAADNPHFSRATVNRVWAHLFGRPIVEPVDDMRDDGRAVCPELLNELAESFVASGFDLRRLFKALTMSEAYQLSSRSSEDAPTRLQYFAQMNVKPFTSEQLYDSISLAAQFEPAAAESGEDRSLSRISNTTRRTFLERFRAPPGHVTDYHAGIPRALAMMNGPLVSSATDLECSGLLRSLQAPFLSDSQRIETLFLATLSRKPRDDERGALLEQFSVADSDEDKQEILADVLWALLNSAEFTLNH